MNLVGKNAVKWIGLLLLLAAIKPINSWLRRHPGDIEKALMLMGFLPWVLDFHLYMALVSRVEWPGYLSGIEVTVLDALTLAVYLSLPRANHLLPFRISMGLYFFAVLISVFQARYAWLPALFYPWQLARMFLFYATVTTACATYPRAALALLKGMSAGLLFEAGDVLWERFALGVLQAGGTENHQNVLGMMSHFVVFPLFALLLSRRREWWTSSGSLAGIIVQILTVSRATVGLGLFGYVAVFLLSIAREWTSRKAVILFVSLAAVAVLAPLTLESFQKRFAVQSFGTYDERVALEKMASLIVSDYPMGVGADNFVIVAIVDGYSQRAGVIPNSRLAVVHNIYWLVTAETGFLGLIALLNFLVRPLMVAFVCGWRHRKDVRGDLLLGLGVSLLILYIHSLFEWVLITYQPQYFFTLELGMIAGLAQQLGYWPQSAGLLAGRPRLGLETLQSGRARNIRYTRR